MFEEASKQNDESYHRWEEKITDGLLGMFGWDLELFIPEEYYSYLSIVSKKNVNHQYFQDLQD